MKFAHEFKAALIQEGYPPHWVDSAIPYGQLKKLIKKVTLELKSLGLDPEVLAQLVSEVDPSSPISNNSNGVAFLYDFDDTGDKTPFQPKLTLLLRDGLAIDATLSPDTRIYLKNLVAKQRGIKSAADGADPPNEVDSEDEIVTNSPTSTIPGEKPIIQRIEVPLTFDAEFFQKLQDEVEILESLQVGEQKALVGEIAALSNNMTALAKPSRFRKTDLYRWRELFEIYLQAMVFFSTHEVDHGSRNSGSAAKQLQWFQSEIMRRGIISSFKLPASRQAFERFVNINITLLRNLKFQEINQTAISKILKKFDKRTHLGAQSKFPKLIGSATTMSEDMAKAVCSQLSQELIKKVPQLDDYMCPICFTIAWRPVRMACKHILCISCAVTLQRKRQRFCPLCREDVILKADADNIDSEVENFIEKYFPKEAREKRIAVETERGKEQFGESYKHPSEQRCVVM